MDHWLRTMSHSGDCHPVIGYDGSMYREYARELHRTFGYFGTWLPGTVLGLGDVGTIERGEFQRVTSLRDLGIRFESNAQHFRDGQVKYEHGVTQDFALTSHVGELHAAKASIDLQFTKAGSTILHAVDVVARRS